MNIHFELVGACCIDCADAIANYDFTGLDYHYSEREARERMAEILAGMDGRALSIGEECGFSWRACDCCGSRLGGDRFELFEGFEGGDN